MQKPKKVSWLGSFRFFFKDKKPVFFLDTEKLYSVLEYTVADNLTGKLLVEDMSKSGEFLPSLAKNWVYSESSGELKFLLRDNLKWSDGSSIEPISFLDHFSNLSSKSHLHLTEIKNLSWKLDSNFLITKVETKNLSTVLFELSTPDAGLVKSNAFNVSSGSFFVEKVTKGFDIVLRKNPYFYGNEDGPEIVILDHCDSNVTSDNVLKAIDAKSDILSVSPWWFSDQSLEPALNKDYRLIEGVKFNLSFFVLPFSLSEEKRKYIAGTINTIKNNHNTKKNKNFEIADQLFPLGYDGRVGLSSLKEVKDSHLENPYIGGAIPFFDLLTVVDSNPYFKNIVTSFEELTSSKLNLVKDPMAADLRLMAFKGSQRNHNVSWSFLVKAESVFKEHYKYFLEKNKISNYDLFQQWLLENNYFVPFSFSTDRFLLSSRIKKVENLDPLNMQLRLDRIKISK